MNSGIFVCVLGLLVCHATVCVGVPRLSGGCTLSDLKPEQRSMCVSVDCIQRKDGTFLTPFSECGYSRPPQCPGNDFTVIEYPELTYPDCCPKIKCKN